MGTEESLDLLGKRMNQFDQFRLTSIEVTWGGLKACNFIKKRLQRMCFPVKFAKF